MGWKHKGWDGLGAFNAEERKLANDLLGFKAHLVFPTSAFDQVLAAKEPKVILGGVEALNKGMAEFCSVDKRMFGAAYIPFSHGEEIALNMLKQSIKQGSKVILIDTIAPKGTKALLIQILMLFGKPYKIMTLLLLSTLVQIIAGILFLYLFIITAVKFLRIRKEMHLEMH